MKFFSRESGGQDIVRIIVEGFFISTIVQIILTSLMLMFHIPLTPLNYSLITLVIIIASTVQASRKKFNATNYGKLLVSITFLVYAFLLIFFSNLPRMFRPDETKYIFSSRIGLLDGQITPIMEFSPNKSEALAVLDGRYFWIYLVTSFLGSTGLLPYQAGLFGVSYLVMTALASTLLVEDHKLRIATLILVAGNPLLILHSGLALNDLAIAFYSTFSIVFFVNSFSNFGGTVSINIRELIYSLLGIIFLSLIKLNLTSAVGMWILLIYIVIRHKLHRRSRKYKALLIILLVPLVIYEVVFEIPYIIITRIIRDFQPGPLFSFLLENRPIRPFEMLIRWFTPSWHNPSSQTLFTQSFTTYTDYLYRLLMPEFHSLIISAILLVSPLLLVWKSLLEDFRTRVLAVLVIVAMCIFYLQSVVAFSLYDVGKYAPFLVPIFVSLATIILFRIVEKRTFGALMVVQLAMLFILWLNLLLAREKNGVYIGFPGNRGYTADILMVHLTIFIVMASLITMKKRNAYDKVKLPFIGKRLDFKKLCFSLLLISIIVHNLCLSYYFIKESSAYQNRDFIKINNILERFADDKTPIFVNNYIFLKPYLSDKLVKSGLIFPSPDSVDEFFDLFEAAPNGTLLLISDDPMTSWFEYGNKYLKQYASAEIILPETLKTKAKLPKINLPNNILYMTFDDANASVVPDHSPFKNDGINNGACVVDGYYGKALYFDGNSYVSIRNNPSLDLQNAVTISFLALIEKSERLLDYMIVSKGYARPDREGSFDIFIYKDKIYFEIDGAGSLAFPVDPYLDEWHHFVFTYNGKLISAYVDGVLVSSKPSEGFIKSTSWDLEIGRDSQRQRCYFKGLIDELQISKEPLNTTQLAITYYDNFWLRIYGETNLNWHVSLFKLIKKNVINNPQELYVKNTTIYIDKDLSVDIGLEIETYSENNVTILIATDRFTKVYITGLTLGNNKIKFEFPYTIYGRRLGGSYWRYFTHARIILINEGYVVYSGAVSPYTFSEINLLITLIICVVFLVYGVLSFIRSPTSLRRSNVEVA